MEKFSMGETILCKMAVAEFDDEFGADAEAQYGKGLETLYWAVVLGDNGEEVGMTAELMLEFAGRKFAYTSRGCTMMAQTFCEALNIMLGSMETF
jgi:hypothetical protein